MTKFRNYPSCHEHISSLDSGSTPEAFVRREVELETGSVTVTDHGSLAVVPQLYELAKKNGLILVPGYEGYLRDDSDPILRNAGVDAKEYQKFGGKDSKYMHVTIHAKDIEAYEVLVQEVSKADFRAEQHGSERKPLFGWENLERLGGYNITMGSGCLIGVVARHLMVGRPDLATAYYEKLRSIPKAGNFFVEQFPHVCDRNFVSGCFVTLEGDEKLKFWKGKKLKTTVGEFSAEELTKLASRGKPVGQLVAVMNNRKWEEREPKTIIAAKLVDDFIQNDCTPEAPNGDIQLPANRFLLELAKKYGDRVQPSDDSHIAVPEDKLVQDSRLMSQGGSWKFHTSYHRQSSAESYEYFKNVMGVSEKEFEGWVENAREWAQGFKDFKFKERKSLPVKFYPSNTLEHFKTLIDKHGRMDWSNPQWVDRLKSEITLLHANGTIDLLPYFFLAEEATSLYEKHKKINGPGRGSASGMLTAYLLGITHVDPLRFKLSQDRFLTVDRIKSGKYPDVDLDFSDRDLLLNPETGWIAQRFGDHAAAVSTRTMLRLKSSIKDVARATHGFVSPEIEALTKKLDIPPQGVEDYDWIFGYTGDDGKEVRGYLEQSKELQEYVRQYPSEWELVKKFLGIVRNASRHACAYVIANEPISNFIPLQTMSGIRTTQYDAPGVEAVGGLKMDFLGVSSLNDIQECIALIQRRHGGPIKEDRTISGKRVPGFRLVPYKDSHYDVWDLPWDQNVGNMIAEGKTETVFQLNTPSARQWLRQFNYEKAPGVKAIDSFEAIAAFTALDRPGPLDADVEDADGRKHNMLVEYANRQKGLPAIGEIPALNQMLPESKGIIVFQESLEFVFRELSGCSASEAEEFRRNVAKKKMDKVKKVYPAFMEGATAKIGKEQAQAVFDQLVTFGQYGFCILDTQEIITVDGKKSIKDLGVADLVACLDEATGEIFFDRALRVWNSGQKEVLEVELEDGSFIRATEDHLFLYEGRWVKLKDLILIGYVEVHTQKLQFPPKKLLIKSVETLGMRDVYDVTMPKHHNFILANGAVAHNCQAHAQAYGIIGYSSAFLKLHYPTEWWCAVLRNADKKEITEKFWKYCSGMVDLPDIRYSGENFEIQNGRIRAPLSFLHGVGPTAHEELMSLRPFTSIEELCVKINQRKLALAKPSLEKDGTPKLDKKGNPKMSLGRSALNSGVVGRLIVSGVADSLFPPDLAIVQKLQLFEDSLAASHNELNGTKKKAKKPKEELCNLTALSRYQLQKEFLPIYSEPLQEIAFRSGFHGLVLSKRNVGQYLYEPTRDSVIQDIKAQKDGKMYQSALPIVSGEQLKYLNDLSVEDKQAFSVAVIGYVVAERRFFYKGGASEAIDLTFDVEGETFSFVKWPERKTGKLRAPPAGLPGSLVLLTLNRYRNDRPFTIDCIQVVQGPLGQDKEEDEDE